MCPCPARPSPQYRPASGSVASDRSHLLTNYAFARPDMKIRKIIITDFSVGKKNHCTVLNEVFHGCRRNPVFFRNRVSRREHVKWVRRRRLPRLYLTAIFWHRAQQTLQALRQVPAISRLDSHFVSIGRNRLHHLSELLSKRRVHLWIIRIFCGPIFAMSFIELTPCQTNWVIRWRLEEWDLAHVRIFGLVIHFHEYTVLGRDYSHSRIIICTCGKNYSQMTKYCHFENGVADPWH